jgi:hypothetical protein
MNHCISISRLFGTKTWQNKSISGQGITPASPARRVFLPFRFRRRLRHSRYRPMDFSQFNAAEQAHLSRVIERKQVRYFHALFSFSFCRIERGCLFQMQDFMRMYSNLVERCFTTCANDFTSKALSSKEVRVRKLNNVWVDLLNSSTGELCHELCRQVPQALGTYWCALCGTERWYV